MKNMKPPKMRKVKSESYGSGKNKMTSDKTVSFKSSELPEIKDWKVGEDYSIKIKVTQTSTRLEGKEVIASFKVNSVGDCTK